MVDRERTNILYLRARVHTTGVVFHVETRRVQVSNKFEAKIADRKRPAKMPRKQPLRKDRFFTFFYNTEWRLIQGTKRTLNQKELEEELVVDREIIIAVSYDGKSAEPIGWGWASQFDPEQQRALDAEKKREEKRVLTKVESAQAAEDDPGGW